MDEAGVKKNDPVADGTMRRRHLRKPPPASRHEGAIALLDRERALGGFDHQVPTSDNDEHMIFRTYETIAEPVETHRLSKVRRAEIIARGRHARGLSEGGRPLVGPRLKITQCSVHIRRRTSPYRLRPPALMR